MEELAPGLYVGGKADYRNLRTVKGWAFVSTSQTIHYRLFGWNHTSNKPDRNHPSYLTHETDSLLSLNWTDGKASLYEWSGPETFTKALDFIDRQRETKNVLVFCDQGRSRSPTLCLLYLAKRLGSLPVSSFEEARRTFSYASYAPGGIGQYVAEHWTQIH